MAFREFLKVLETAPSVQQVPFEDPKGYQEALKLYLSSHSGNVASISKAIVDTYSPLLENQPGSQLGFIVAAAYANLGDFINYFDYLYASYKVYPDHYLVNKSKAILHLKLFVRFPPGPEKEQERAALQKELTAAANKFPNDTSLYRLMITYAEDSKKKDIVATSLNRIIDMDIFIPRADLDFYIQNAFANAPVELTEKFICRAKQWYEFSRVVAAAQQRLNEQEAIRGRHHE
jgi:hypothetical protein